VFTASCLARDIHDDWHNDCCDSRLIGVSVNLSPEPYNGGVFQLREAATGKC